MNIYQSAGGVIIGGFLMLNLLVTLDRNHKQSGEHLVIDDGSRPAITNDEAQPFSLMTTNWIGKITVGRDGPGNDTFGVGGIRYLPTTEIGLRSDGVVVWRDKP